MKLPSCIERAFPARPTDSSKYSVGTVAIIGGCAHYPCAPAIAALGARAAGAGLVKLVAPDETRAAAGALVPEATFTTLADIDEFPRTDATACGMGFGRAPVGGKAVAKLLAQSGKKLVMDADALFFLSRRRGALSTHKLNSANDVILTPHEGEAAMLLGSDRESVVHDRRGAALEIAALYGATTVLKGHRTLVVSANGSSIYENETGNPAMALGGMGDLLAGAIAARWAYLKGSAFEAAASAVWLHGAASDRLLENGGDPSIACTASSMGALRAALERRNETSQGGPTWALSTTKA